MKHTLRNDGYMTLVSLGLIFGFWGSKIPQNVFLSALDAGEPPCKI